MTACEVCRSPKLSATVNEPVSDAETVACIVHMSQYRIVKMKKETELETEMGALEINQH